MEKTSFSVWTKLSSLTLVFCLLIILGCTTDWDMAGITSSDDVQTWRNAGFRPREAGKWEAAGITPTEAGYWLQAGFTPEEAGEWKQAGFTPQEAEGWKDEGDFLTRKVGETGFTPQEAGKWKQAGFTPQEAREWLQAGFTSQSRHSDPLAVTNFLDTKSPKEAGEWKQAGFTPQEAEKWKQAEFTPEDALRWKQAGFTPEEAEGWKAARISLTRAKKWKQAGFTPEEAGKWWLSGFSLKEASGWKAIGFSPNRAKKEKQAGSTLSEVKTKEKALARRKALFIKRYCHLGFIKAPLTLFMHNPYSLKKHCIEANFAVYQYISKSQALVFIFYLNGYPISPDFSRQHLFYLVTGKHAIPTGGPLGLTPIMDVHFTGVYQYTNVLGALETVPVIRP